MLSSGAIASTELVIRGSLIEESYSLFRQWDFAASQAENMAQLARSNVISARSESWNKKVLSEFRRRFDVEDRDRGLALLAHQGCALDVWRPLLLWHLFRSDVLLRDFMTNWLFDQYSQGVSVVRAPDVWPYLDELHTRGLTIGAWSHKTVTRVASQLLHFAADFGLMTGRLAREFASYHLPDESFLYLLHAMVELQPNAREVVHSPDWRVFLMDADDVERELFRLHQFRRVHYEVAGSLAQLKLPCASAADYVREMLT